ncbi:MAG: hypothetical protein ACYCZR_10690 [Burkholderiales bacterium]
MNVWASFFDPSNDGFDMNDFSMILGIIIGGGGAYWVLNKVGSWVVDKFTEKVEVIVRAVIEEYTRPIQKETNGGFSLPDVARGTDWNKRALKAIAEAQGIDLPPDPTTFENTP